jgi:hypothetical protein
VYMCRCHSFAIPLYTNCESVRVCLVIDLSFLCAPFPLSPRLYYTCVMCEVSVWHILRFAFLFLWPGYVLYIGFFMCVPSV